MTFYKMYSNVIITNKYALIFQNTYFILFKTNNVIFLV